MTIDGTASPEPELDFRGSRRLTGGEEWFWYIFAAVTYIVAGIWQKFLLNWIIGPIWLVTIICVGPPIGTWLGSWFGGVLTRRRS